MATIAPGSQKWKGICADLVKAARITSVATAASWCAVSTSGAAAMTTAISVVPTAVASTTTAASRASPPAPVITRARVDGQAPTVPWPAISRNEHSVVSSQKTSSSTRSPASTSPTIAAANSVSTRNSRACRPGER